MPREITEIFSEKVSERLKQLDKSTDWLGACLDIDGSGVRKVLNEKRAPRIDTLLKWAKALDVPPNWLLGQEDANHFLEQRKLAAITGILALPPNHLETVLELIESLIKTSSKKGNGSSSATR